MGWFPGRPDAIRGVTALAAGGAAFAGILLVVQFSPIGTGPTELLWDLLATFVVSAAPVVALYYWVVQPHSE